MLYMLKTVIFNELIKYLLVNLIFESFKYKNGRSFQFVEILDHSSIFCLGKVVHNGSFLLIIDNTGTAVLSQPFTFFKS